MLKSNEYKSSHRELRHGHYFNIYVRANGALQINNKYRRGIGLLLEKIDLMLFGPQIKVRAIA
jgi:hypothetical protein